MYACSSSGAQALQCSPIPKSDLFVGARAKVCCIRAEAEERERDYGLRAQLFASVWLIKQLLGSCARYEELKKEKNKKPLQPKDERNEAAAVP